MGLKAVASTSLANATLSDPTFTGTVTASQVTGIERVLAQWSVPVILASSGTMGDNGAISGMTALPKTYSNGAWLYLPANSIDGSNAAGFYWFVGSSTTAGTVYNSTFDGASVPAAGTATAFVSTGPGAFTGIATGEIVAATVTVPANAIGASGELSAAAHLNHNTAAGNKITRVRYSGAAGTTYWAYTTTTTPPARGELSIRNHGAGQQSGSSLISYANGAQGLALSYSAADTTAATTLVFTLEKATATNHVMWEGGKVKIAYGS